MASMKGKVVLDITIPAKTGKAFVVKKGQYLHVIDVEGEQVADTVFFNAIDLKERFKPSFTRMNNDPSFPGEYLKLNIGAGDKLYSNKNRAMFTITEERVHLVGPNFGAHDCGLCGMCNPYSAEHRRMEDYKAKGYDVSKPFARPNCLNNFVKALKDWNVEETDIPDPFTFFMAVKVHPTGRIEITGPDTKPGDYVELRAEMDCVVAISACPNDVNPAINRGKCKPIRAIVYEETST